MSAVFYADDAQKAVARAGRDRESARLGTPVTTALLPLNTFYRAEDYHQKYLLRNNRALFAELKAQYPEVKALVDSTSAARINGYLGGNGRKEQLDREIDGFGLSEAGRRALRDLVR